MGKKSHGEDKKDAAENIKVLVRCRPLNTKELDHGYKSCVDLDLSEATVTVNHVCGNPDRWTFDAVINNTYTQRDVFTQYIMPMVDSVLDGFNATVFAYGQSGSGKTHTMTGKIDDEELKGLIPRSFEHVFATIRQVQTTNPGKRFTLYCSFIELYNNKIRDLLAKQQVSLPVKENKDKTFFVQGAHIPQVKFPEDLYRHMEEGTDRRQVASTDLNADSSRSHSIFTLIVECTETTEDGDTRSVTSKLNLVDLAGSERQSKTGASGDTLKEGCNINLSLSALGTVIDTLVKGKGHVPFRSSPLTMLLKDSLGGSSKTVMFANIGPSEHNLSETVSTLRFADRAKQIKNKPVVNMDTKDQKIAELSELVHELKEKLKQFETGGFAEMEEELEGLRERVGELEVERDNAVKGRESDTLDFETAQSQLRAELDAATARREELEEKLEQVQQDFIVAEQCVKDERAQRAEVWRACSAAYDCEVDSIDALLEKVRDDKHGANSEAFLKLQSENHTLEQELKASREQGQADAAELRALVEQANERHKAAVKKFEKAKEMLEQERAARKQLVESHQSAGNTNNSTSPTRAGSMTAAHHHRGSVVRASAAAATVSDASPSEGGGGQWLLERRELESRHAAEVAELRAALEKLEADIAANARVQELEAELAELSAAKKRAVAALQEELEQSARLLAAPAEEESVGVAHLKRLLATKDEALLTTRRDMEALEDVVAQLRRLARENPSVVARRRRGVRRAQKKSAGAASPPPIADAEGAEQQAEVEAEVEEDVDAALVELHRNERAALHTELVATSSHRNELLNHLLANVAAGDADMSTLKRITEELASENDALRQRCLAAEAERGATKRDELIVSQLQRRIRDLEAELATSAHSSQEVVALNGAVAALQQQLDRTRADASEREEQLLRAVGGDRGSAESDTHPMQAVVRLLQDEKAALTEHARGLERELHAATMALAAEHGRVVGATSSAESTLKEVDRLHELMAHPSADDGAEVALLKEELRRRDDELATLRAQSPAAFAAGGSAPLPPLSGERSIIGEGEAGRAAENSRVADIEEELRRMESVHQQRVSMFEIEKEELVGEVVGLRADLEAEREQRERAEADAQRALHDAKQQHAELAAAQRESVALQNRLNEQRAELSRVQQSSEGFTGQLAQVEARLKERTEQLGDVRRTLEKQKEITQAVQAKNDSLRERVAALQADLKERTADFAKALAEKEAAIHRAMNKKIELLAQEHQRDLARKDEEVQKVKKKVRKMEGQVQKAKEKYDEKVLEYEELSNRMEEQKVEAMRLMQGPSGIVEIEEHKEQIGDALKRAKEERQRQKDMFAMGETTSALAKVRAAGTAAATVKKLKGSSSSSAAAAGGGSGQPRMGSATQPKRSPATYTPSDEGFDDFDF